MTKKKRRVNKKRLLLVLVPFFILIILLGYLVFHLVTSFLGDDVVQETTNTTTETVHNTTYGALPKSGSLPSAVANSSDQITGKTVVLDPGHGGYDGGSEAADGTLEKDVTLSIALQTKAKLEAQGYTVLLTRDSDVVNWPSIEIQDLWARCNYANASTGDVFVSIHTNASEFGDGARGTEVWVNMNDQTKIDLATNINTELANLQYTQDRGVRDEESSLMVLEFIYMPAVLVEVGFITDGQDKDYIVSTSGQDNIAQALTNGIIQTLE